MNSTITKVIAMLNNCESSLDVQEVWTKVNGWKMPTEEFEQIERIVMAEFSTFAMWEE